MTCPICGKGDCKGYPLMWDRYAAGRNRDHWRKLHDRINGGLPTSEVVESHPGPDPWADRIYACPDYNPSCCASPAPFCSRFLISPTRDHCIKCLGGDG